MACHFIRWDTTSGILNTHRLSSDLIENTLNFSIKRRRRFLQGRILLAEMMFYLYRLPILPPITTTPTGRPHFVDPHLPDFSLAYAGNTVGALLSLEGKVGLDIEVMRARGRNLQQQYQSVTEHAWIEAQHDRLEAETQLWSIRQCVLKLCGLSNDEQGTLHLHPFSGHLRSSATPHVQVMSDAGEYLSWACARTPGLERLICWQYDDRLGLRKSSEISSRRPSPSTHFLKLTSLSVR
jgi:phosphopantetheinyl transferase